MTKSRQTRMTWGFECVMPSGNRINSWFYADSEEEAKHRITDYMGAKLIKIAQIDHPLAEIKKANSLDDGEEIRSNPLFKKL